MENETSDKTRVVCPEMGYYCFDSLIDHLKGTNNTKKPSFTNDSYPLFVTWHKEPQDQLRGCIGTFSPRPLHQGIKEYAIQSATNDTRFPSVELHEIESLNVAVSILTNFEDAENYLDWTIGKHGIQVHFCCPTDKVSRSSTYLPEVALEHEMDKLTAINQLVRKAGYRGKIDEKLLDSIRLRRYQSEKIKVDYDQYKAASGN